MRRAQAIFASLMFPPLGPLLLGHYRVVSSLAVEALAAAMLVCAAFWSSPALLGIGIFIALLNRAAMVRGAATLTVEESPRESIRGGLFLLGVIAFEVALMYGPREYLVEAFKIPSGSMIPTLQIGDHLFVDKRKVEPKRGDVIVFRYPREPDKEFIKRVIAVGGDRVEWQAEIPLVNGTPILRKPIDGDCRYRDLDEGRWQERSCRAFQETFDGRSWRIFQDRGENAHSFNPFVVPAGNYYVVGDNRDNSHDSRYFGGVPAENVKGVAIGIWYSYDTDVHWERFGQVVK